jgi:hypothetical protein
MSDQTKLPSESEIKKERVQEEKVILRSYSKVILFYPLLIISFVLFLIQIIMGADEQWLGAIWITVFFINLFIISFDTSSTKFFILLLVIIVLILVFTFIFNPIVIIGKIFSFEVLIVMSYQFYLSCTVILIIVLLIAWIATRFNYWKIERNEVIHKQGIIVSVKRYPTKSLRIEKDIPDLFEFMLLGAGSIQLFFANQEVIHLSTIIKVNKKSKNIDYLLSDIQVEMEKTE